MMAVCDKTKDILDFVNKTCNLFDSYIEYNNNLVIKFQSLKQFGQTIIDDLSKENIIVNDVINEPNTSTHFLNSESCVNNIQATSNCLAQSISVETTASNENDQMETEETSPMSPSLISPNTSLNAFNTFKTSLDLLLEHIQANPILDETVATKEIISIENDCLNKPVNQFLNYPLKKCSVLLTKIDISNLKIDHSAIQKSSDEDLEINRLCDIENILNTNSKSISEIINSNISKSNSNQIKEVSNDESSETSNSDDDNESEIESNLQEYMLSMGLVLRNEKDNQKSKGDELNNDSSFSGDEEAENTETSKKTKKLTSKNKEHNKMIRPDLAIPRLESSDDEEKSKNKKNSIEDEPVEKDTDDKVEKESTSSNSPEVLPTENVEDYQQLDEDDRDCEDDDEIDIIKSVKKSKRKFRISSTDETSSSSTNDQEKRISPEIEELGDSPIIDESESLSNNKEPSNKSDDEIIKPKKRRTRKRKSIDSDGEEDQIDEETEKRENEKRKFRRMKREKKKFKKEPRDTEAVDEEEETNSKNSDSSVVEVNSDEEKEPTRHKLRDVIDDKKLAKETQEAERAEKERIKRLKEKEEIYKNLKNDNMEGVYLDIDPETKKGLLRIDDALVRVLKPYQLEGVRFMWNSCFESVKQVSKEKNEGGGCILAHCMGLGKTLQVITLVNTLLANEKSTKCSKVLILMPVNVLLNWKSEFSSWQKDCEHKVKVYGLPNDKSGKDKIIQRFEELEKWSNKGGVFVMGYQIFTTLVNGTNVKPKRYVEKFKSILINPGPDLIICDEGHELKNATSKRAKTINQVRTKRRIVLTGTPLQNNLIEYHCMVSFVKPNLLGTTKEFRNRFMNPITNGQHKDSTEADVRMMKRRAHVLHQALDGCVNRKDFYVIREFLPPKSEYVLSIRLSEKQILLYSTYLVKQRGIENINNLGKVQGSQLFADFQVLMRVWTHPWLLKINETRQQKNELKASEKNFINDEDDDEELEEVENQIVDDDDVIEETRSDKTSSVSDDEIILENPSAATTSKQSKYKTRSSRIGVSGGGVNNDVDETSSTKSDQSSTDTKWWTELVAPEYEFDFEISGKLVVLSQILEICQEKRDKLVLFSQSLMSLDLIEKFLVYLEQQGKATWTKNKDYFRIDGNTDINKRKDQIKSFNDLDQPRSRLFLISTRAGGIGINLIGANRCIVFDASWNPTHDTQSIFRIYRLGQTKEVFIYRFLSQGTMEEKIYQRQVNKQSLSQRVVDEHQVERHFTNNELSELYAFEPDTDASEIPNLPGDDLLKRLLLDCKKWIVRYHDHESLLENKLDEGLSEEDRKAAWDEYEAERNRATLMDNFNREQQFANNINNFNPLTMAPQFVNVNTAGFNSNPRMPINYQYNNNNFPFNQYTQPNLRPNFPYNNMNILNNINPTQNQKQNFHGNASNLNQLLGVTQNQRAGPSQPEDLYAKYKNALTIQEKTHWLNQIKIKNPQLYQQLLIANAKSNANVSNLIARAPQPPQQQQQNLRINNQVMQHNQQRASNLNSTLSNTQLSQLINQSNRSPTQNSTKDVAYHHIDASKQKP